MSKMKGYGLLNEPIVARDLESLDSIGSLLHDETAELDEAIFDQANSELILPFRRQFHGGLERMIKKTVFGTIYEKEWMRSEINIEGVESWSIEDDQEIGDYTFNELEWRDGMIILYFCECTSVLVHTRKIDVSMSDLGFRGKARIERSFKGSEISSHAIY